MVEKIPNQATVHDSQNNDIDIDKVFKDFILEIDAVRSFINTSNKENEVKLKSLNDKNIMEISSSLKMEKSPQESRCHAFYRLIGFPVINSSKTKMYNPGLDIIPGVKLQDKSAKVSIATDPIPDFVKVSYERENYLSKIQNVFYSNRTLNSSLLLLSSSTAIRKFIAPLEKNTDPFDIKVVDSKYSMDAHGIVGKGNSIPLSEYVDSAGKTATFAFNGGGSFNDKQHIIGPFIVDPKIDFSVTPSKNLVAVPFVPSRNSLKINDTDYVKRPLIEKIIRERYAIDNEVNIGDFNKSVVDFIKDFDSIKDESLIKRITKTDGTYKLTEQAQFAKYLNIIRAMSQKLVRAQKIIESAQSQYYFLPIPNVNGPEYGCDFYPTFLKVPEKFRTTKEKDIILLKIQTVVNELPDQQTTSNGSPESIDFNFAFDSVKTTFGSDTSEAYGDVAARNLQQIVRIRSSILKDACNALRDIEIIMGEFSGLGLSDIVAIMGALYIIPRENLLGFLDDDAFDRMKLALPHVKDSKPGLTESYTIFTNVVKDLYNIMDKIYKDNRSNNT